MTAMTTTTATILEARGLTLVTPTGRVLVQDLDLTLERERVALVGRNGVGKSSLIAALGGLEAPHRGTVRCRADRVVVPQGLGPDDAPPAGLDASGGPTLERALVELGLGLDALTGAPLSRGERRKLHLLAARRRRAGLTLLDEPTEDLDVVGIDWLGGWLAHPAGALVVATHDRQLLATFRHFFVLEESGCRYFGGSFAALEEDLERRHERDQARCARQLNDLVAKERHDAAVRRRRRRKKNLGRLHEERRAPARAQLMAKKGYAQKSQAKAAKIREARIEAARQWAHAVRRAASVRLPLELALPDLGPDDGRNLVALSGVAVKRGDRTLFTGLDLRLGRDRLGVVGPNGAGKTTLLGTLQGAVEPAAGEVVVLSPQIGFLEQGATDHRLDESLVERLVALRADLSAEVAAQLVVAHRFPLGLALRPMRSLSAGELTRAALICLYQRAPEMLVLDEPTAGLDFMAAGALVASLARWRGGLIVASHDRGFLAAIGVRRCLALDGHGGHRFTTAAARPSDEEI